MERAQRRTSFFTPRCLQGFKPLLSPGVFVLLNLFNRLIEVERDTPNVGGKSVLLLHLVEEGDRG